jgi:hypothetical protein
MTPEITLLLGSIIGGTGALLSYWAGWRARGDVMRIRGGVVGSRRGTTCGGGEITRAQWEAMRTPFIEGRTQRGNGNGGPTTPKPEITPRGQWPGGYQPRPSRPGANPPPSEP